MAQSVVIDTIEKTHTSTQYGYDAFGRRNLVQDQGSSTMRTLYDGFSFDIVQEAEVFQGGDFTTSYMELGSIQYTQTQTGTSRYRYVGDDPKTVTLGDLTQESTRYTGSRATLYANGQAVATNRSASLYDNGRAYFGTDILGSVRSATDDYASLEDRYEYDIFGTPYEGDFTSGLNTGYTGKPYDTTTGLYNYGYRDYSPQQARFTTVDPIRDGNNWFSYVVNDPVNYVDLWGLESEAYCGSDNVDAGSNTDTTESATSITFSIQSIAPSRLRDLQDVVMAAPMYQEDAGGPFNLPEMGKTWCNQSTFDIAENTGFNLDALYNGGERYMTTANQAIENLNLAVSNGTINSTTNPVYAQNLANQGYTVIAGKPKENGSGHLSTLRPWSFANFIHGATVANVGVENEVKTVADAFITTVGVVYYYDTNQTFLPNGTGVAQEQ